MTVNDLMVKLNSEGWDLPTINNFPVGSTARTLYEQTITEITNPKYNYRVDRLWAPYFDIAPQQVFIGIHPNTRTIRLIRVAAVEQSRLRRLFGRAREFMRSLTL